MDSMCIELPVLVYKGTNSQTLVILVLFCLFYYSCSHILSTERYLLMKGLKNDIKAIPAISIRRSLTLQSLDTMRTITEMHCYSFSLS